MKVELLYIYIHIILHPARRIQRFANYLEQLSVPIPIIFIIVTILRTMWAKCKRNIGGADVWGANGGEIVVGGIGRMTWW